MSESEVVPTVTTSYSGITDYRACPQRWSYRRIRHLERFEGVAVERDFGSWWHALLVADSLERGRAAGSLLSTPELVETTEDGPSFRGDSVTVEEVLAEAGHWWRWREQDVQAEFLSRLGAAPPHRLATLLTSWRRQWGEQTATELPLAVELYWERDLPQVSLDGQTGLSTRLIGYVDEVFLDTRHHILVARDWKSHRTLRTQTAADDMMDSQLQLYAWGAAPTIREWGVGGVRAVAYDRSRMTAPKVPQLTLAGRLSKSVTDFDLYTYQEWAAGPDGAGVPFPKKPGERYQAEPLVVERLSSPAARSAWHQRTLTPISASLVRAHLRAAVDAASGMVRTRARFALTGEALCNLTAACRWCDYVALCRVELVGGPDGEVDLGAMGLRPTERRHHNDRRSVPGEPVG